MKGAKLDPARIPAIRSALLDWYRRDHRDLPWRRTNDPYRIWVSETMLQQTQVSTVVPYYERFVARFPDARALAAAPEEEVLSAWSGLGYYSRARNLQSAVREVCERYEGRVPDEYDAFRALPGVGPYTAGAVLSIAFGEPLPVVDGNVSRVLSRLLALAGDPRRGPLKARLWEIARDLVPADSASDFNQGLMELGALVCTPRSPSCLPCPLRGVCEAHRLGREEAFPKKAARKPQRAVESAAAVIRDGQRHVLLVRREEERLLRGLWEFPAVPDLQGADPRPALAHELRARFGVDFAVGEELCRVRHSILERRISVRVYGASPIRGRLRLGRGKKDVRFVDEAAADTVPLAASARKIFREIRRESPSHDSRRTRTKQW